MSGDLERLRRLLGGPETEWIVDRVRTRLARGTPLTGTITLLRASEPQRAAVGRVLGRSVPQGRSVSVSLDQLDDVLLRSDAWPEGLVSAVVALKGPVEDPSERQAVRDAWHAVDRRLVELATERPVLMAWVDGVRSSGRLKRVSSGPDEAMSLVRDLHAVLQALPVRHESLAGFSARALHRAHALDADTALGSLATSAVEILGRGRARPSVWSGESSDDGGGRRRPRPSDPSGDSAGGDAEIARGTAAWRRSVWASVGVLVDDLSSSVLTLGLPGGDTSATASALAHLSRAGQPALLSLRQVVADDPGAVPDVVHVCENPAIVSAAADQLGPPVAPLVCVLGQPGTAAVTLLRQLHDYGATLRFHADFDWGGITIARTLASQVEWEPWRFGAADYLEALQTVKRIGSQLESLAAPDGAAPVTPWDPELSATMARYGLRVEEELVLDDLLADLRADHMSGGSDKLML